MCGTISRLRYICWHGTSGGFLSAGLLAGTLTSGDAEEETCRRSNCTGCMGTDSDGAAREGAGAGLATQKILIKVSFLEHVPISLKNKIILICICNI